MIRAGLAISLAQPQSALESAMMAPISRNLRTHCIAHPPCSVITAELSKPSVDCRRIRHFRLTFELANGKFSRVPRKMTGFACIIGSAQPAAVFVGGSGIHITRLIAHNSSPARIQFTPDRVMEAKSPRAL